MPTEAVAADRPGPRRVSEKPGPARTLVDQSGRALGPRARNTRQRLLEATGSLLAKRPLRELRVVDIAREVGTSPATFYQYFEDVEDAVLELARAASAEMPAVRELIDGAWTGRAGLERAHRIVDAFIHHWDRHHAVLRVRNLASDEGDPRFQRVRTESLAPILDALARQVEASRRAGSIRDDVHPHAAAAALAAILERLAAYHRELEHLGVTREDLVRTSARILYRTVTGRS
jgi:AcrR family transcriptional regulator